MLLWGSAALIASPRRPASMERRNAGHTRSAWRLLVLDHAPAAVHGNIGGSADGVVRGLVAGPFGIRAIGQHGESLLWTNQDTVCHPDLRPARNVTQTFEDSLPPLENPQLRKRHEAPGIERGRYVAAASTKALLNRPQWIFHRRLRRTQRCSVSDGGHD